MDSKSPLPFPGEQNTAELRQRLSDLEKEITGSGLAETSDASAEIRDMFGMLVESSPNFVAIVSAGGRLLYLNATGGRVSGVAPGQLGSQSLADFFSPEAYHTVREAGLPAAQRQGMWQGFSALRMPQGGEMPVMLMIMAHRRPNGSLMFLSFIALDITARRQAEQVLQEQAMLLEQAHDAVVVKDLEDRILRWSAGATRLYGFSPAEAIGQPGRKLFRVDAAAYDQALTATLRDGSWTGELKKNNKTGQPIMVDSRWTLVNNLQGRPYCILSIDADITAQKRLQAQFLRAQRMESIGSLAGGIAHDLNNILAPIVMSVGLLRLKLLDPDSQTTLDTMESSARRGADLVKQVLSFGRGVEGLRGPVSPGRLVHDMQKIAVETFPKSIATSVKIAPDAWNVMGDMTQLHQVLLNLCVNARDAMPQGGRLQIEVGNVTLDETYAGMNSEARPGPHVIIEVADSGTGIPPEVREKMFEPFFTTKEAGHGTGIGLSTAYAIVKGHGGFINVYSEMGKGTQIKVYLPAKPALELAAPEPEQKNLPRGRGETVLVVDDEETIGLVAQRTLERYGYKAIWARHGAEAVAHYARRDPVVDVVVTDMAMPIMDGPATILALRNIDPKVRIIGASGLGSNSKFVHAIGAGLKHFLHKPYTAESLLQMLRLALEDANPGQFPPAPS